VAQAKRRQHRRDTKTSKRAAAPSAGPHHAPACICRELDPRGLDLGARAELSAGLVLLGNPSCPKWQEHVDTARTNYRQRLQDGARRFKELRTELQRRSKLGAVTLTPAECGVVLEGLTLAGAYGPLRQWHNDIVRRDLWASRSLSSGEKDRNKRARVFLNRMQGKDDRSAVPKPSARYDAERIVAHYRALTRREGAGDLMADVTMWDSSLLLPLSAGEALAAICRLYHFSSEQACHKWLERHGALAPRHRRSR